MVKNYALKLAALSIVLLSGILAKAQYTFSVEGKRLSNYEFVSYGIGLSGCKIVKSEKSGKPKALIGFGLSGIMPKTYNYTYSSYSIENNEDLVEAKYKARHSAYLLSLLTSYYFIGNLDSKFAMRFNLNASYMLPPYKYTFTPPEGEESNPGFENFKGSLKGFIFGLGLINFYQSNLVSPFFIILLLWYPGFENFFSILRKSKLKKSPIEPDTNHLHQLMFYYFNKKNLSAKLSSSLVGLIINFYNLGIIYVALLNPAYTQIQLFLIFLNVTVYSYIYIRLLKFKISYL